MSFRQRQKFRIAPSCSVLELCDKTLETGEVIREIEDLSVTQLPNPDLFELKNQLKSGVNLEEVNSKVFSSSVISASAIFKPKTVSKPNGVKNENK